MTKIHKEDFFCGFCLNVTSVEFIDEYPDYPARCLHCKVVTCSNCGAFVKGDNPKFCHGCGTINPQVHCRMYKSSSISGAYAVEAWHTRNKERAEGGYVISTSMEEATSGNSYVTKRTDKGYEDKRQITEEEKAYLQEEKLDPKGRLLLEDLKPTDQINLLIHVRETVESELESAGFKIHCRVGEVYSGTTLVENVRAINDLPCVMSMEASTPLHSDESCH